MSCEGAGLEGLRADRKPGYLVFVVGPSGAGKDTLLAGAKARLAGDERYHFVRRTVTRPAGPAEDNEHLDETHFDTAAAAGRFALTWSAHGLKYGVPATALDRVRAGQIVVCNGSRGALGTARAMFARLKVVLVTAPRSVRERRLAHRGRDADMPARLDRTFAVDATQRADLVIDNSGSIAAATATLVDYLRSLA